MKKGQKITKDGYELIGFPMATMNVTQGNNGSTSHQGVYALDIAGKDTGIEETYAPVTCHFVWADTPANGNAVFLESDKPVKWADGTVDYAKMMFIHDNYIDDIKAVKKFKQGDPFGDEGTAGMAYGNHCHFEIAKGKLVWNKAGAGYGYYGRNARTGVWHLQDSISADQACVVDGTTIKNGNGMSWKTSAQIGGSKPASKDPYTTTLKWIPEEGTATFTRDQIRIHKDTPDGSVIPNVTYNSGNSVRYIAKCAYKGHRWVKYLRSSGGYGVVAVSGSEIHGKDPWATFK